MNYLLEFENDAAYSAYTQSEDWITPNVCHIVEGHKVIWNQYENPTPIETKVVAKYDIGDDEIGNDIRLCHDENGAFTDMEIDGIMQPGIVSNYAFDTKGEHTVKFTLADPSIISDFADCYRLTSIEIPNSVTIIDDGAFGDCYKLTSVIIPSGVTYIGDMAFDGCAELISVTILAPTPPTLNGNMVFNYNAEGRKIYVPSDSVNAYKTASEEWEDLSEDICAIE